MIVLSDVQICLIVWFENEPLCERVWFNRSIYIKRHVHVLIEQRSLTVL